MGDGWERGNVERPGHMKRSLLVYNFYTLWLLKQGNVLLVNVF